MSVIFQGCFINNHDCYDKTECVAKGKSGDKKDLYFCCCEGDMCNTKYNYVPQPILLSTVKSECC